MCEQSTKETNRLKMIFWSFHSMKLHILEGLDKTSCVTSRCVFFLIFGSTTSYLRSGITTRHACNESRTALVPFGKPAFTLTTDEKKEMEHALMH